MSLQAKALRLFCCAMLGLSLTLSGFLTPVATAQAATFDIAAGDTVGLVNAISTATGEGGGIINLALNSTYNISQSRGNFFGNVGPTANWLF